MTQYHQQRGGCKGYREKEYLKSPFSGGRDTPNECKT